MERDIKCYRKFIVQYEQYLFVQLRPCVYSSLHIFNCPCPCVFVVLESSNQFLIAFSVTKNEGKKTTANERGGSNCKLERYVYILWSVEGKREREKKIYTLTLIMTVVELEVCIFRFWFQWTFINGLSFESYSNRKMSNANNHGNRLQN